MKSNPAARPIALVAPERAPHAWVVTRPVRGSDFPLDLTFVLTRDEIQYQDNEVVRKHADKARAMARIRNIRTPILHIGRECDHPSSSHRSRVDARLPAGRQ